MPVTYRLSRVFYFLLDTACPSMDTCAREDAMLTWGEIKTTLYERNNRSWSKVARALGLSDAAVLAYRDGKSIPGFNLVDAIATAIDATRDSVQAALVQARVDRDARRRWGGSPTADSSLSPAPRKPPMPARLIRTTRQYAMAGAR
jgi:transcriptional regulator with XRE-family HTH domain